MCESRFAVQSSRLDARIYRRSDRRGARGLSPLCRLAYFAALAVLPLSAWAFDAPPENAEAAESGGIASSSVDPAPTVETQPSDPQREQKQKFLTVSLAMLMLILLLGLFCVLLVIWWGGRLRHLSRKKSQGETKTNDLWHLQPPKPKVSDGDLPTDDSDPESPNETSTP